MNHPNQHNPTPLAFSHPTVTRNFRLTAKNMTSFGNLRVAHERIRPGAPSRWLLRNVDYERLGVACVHFEDGGASCWELL